MTMNEIIPTGVLNGETETTPVAHEALIGPVCDCTGETRLIGIEPHPRQKHTDVRTYECKKCGQSVAVTVPYIPAKAAGTRK